MLWFKHICPTGSPPHGRGKVFAVLVKTFLSGITPAWAGKSSSARIASGVKLGSPPHGRGKGFSTISWTLLTRITPAWAGKSSGTSYHGRFCWDHPRMGGEKTDVYAKQRPHLGSPPHGRGKEFSFVGFEPHTGITPAWAGKSFTLTKYCRATQDHPRMGGEKDIAPVSPMGVSGSPPHGRGKVTNHFLETLRDGITPAWAGKSCVLGFCFELF